MVMSKRTKKVRDKGSFKGTKDKESKRTVSSKISRCPKCSSDIIEHHSLVSMPLSSSPDDRSNTRKINIEDQDANFVFKFSSCKNCGYSEFYLHNKRSGTRV